MTDARKRAEEALAKWDEHDSYFRERGRKYEGMSRACARSLAAALRAVLAEEDERGAEGLTPEVAATMNAHSLAELRPASPAPDEVREAAEELQRIDNLLARRVTLDGLTRVQKIALALRVCEETDPKGAIAARYTAARGGE